jgi:adenylate cyclase
MAKILIVDDSNVIAGVLEDFFSNQGHEVLRGANGLEGVLLTYREIPDIIVSDVEMPRLQGYQMSRLLKSKRGVRDIPIIMHTSLSEDRDRFWAMSSGVEAYVTKDFDNLERLGELVTELLAKATAPDRELIREDSAGIDEENVMELLGNLFDRELFRSTILNELSAVEKYISSLPQSCLEILSLLTRICEAHLGSLILKFGKKALVFHLPSSQVFREDLEGFQEICLADFREQSGLSEEDITQVVFGLEERSDFDKLRSDHRRLSSYALFPLQGKGEEIIGTLHVGNLSNNYFSDVISDNIAVFAKGVGMVLENAILYNRVNDMEKKIRGVFSKFVPPEIINEMLERSEGDTEMRVGEKRTVAILFSDIRSFTVISENNSAEKIVTFLNAYFQQMVSFIKESGGVVDKFIGDAILAIFGAPVSYEDNAARAVRAAVSMIGKLPEISAAGVTLPPEGFNIGIGIHEGSVIVGNIGSQDKFDYTVIGDNVNLASRLEGITKHYHRQIIISETVALKVRDEFSLREVDTVRVKGKEEPTTLFSVNTDLDVTMNQEGEEAYRKGLQLYKIGNWLTAGEYFAKVLEAVPGDYLSEMYLKRCAAFEKEPPPENWGGAITLDFK